MSRGPHVVASIVLTCAALATVVWSVVTDMMDARRSASEPATVSQPEPVIDAAPPGYVLWIDPRTKCHYFVGSANQPVQPRLNKYGQDALCARAGAVP